MKRVLPQSMMQSELEQAKQQKEKLATLQNQEEDQVNQEDSSDNEQEEIKNIIVANDKSTVKKDSVKKRDEKALSKNEKAF